MSGKCQEWRGSRG